MKAKRTVGKVVEEVILAIATIIMMIPVYYFVIGAFKPRKEIIHHPLEITPEMFTLDNFTSAIKDMKYWDALANTVFITVMALLVVIVCASLAGFAVSRLRHKLFNTYYSVLVTLMVIPFIGCLLPIAKQVEVMNLRNLLGCILIQAAWNMPFCVFLYSGFMQGIPKELEEAAYLDGCSTFGVYARVFLPLLAPVTATCCIRQGVGIWNDYLVSFALLNENKNPTLMVGINSFFGPRSNEYGEAFAGIVLVSIPMIIMFLALQKYFIKGIAAGAVKG